MRKIIHLDLDAFFCAVEEQANPELRGRPFAVGGRPDERGVVASCSYAARRFGVRSALPMSQAVRLCPGLLIVPARHGAYTAVSKQVMARLHALTPQVEQVSIDEAFLDVTDLAEEAESIAHRLQATIRDELGLPCSLGVAASKLVAKIANNVGKATAHRTGRGDGPPNAITVVPPGREAEFLAPLPAGELWGVGPKTAEKLAELGIRTIGDIVAWPTADLAHRFGRHGEELARHARALDDRPVITQRERKSVSQEVTFTRDVGDGAALRRTLREQAFEVARILQRKELMGATVKLKLRRADFTTFTRQSTFDRPTDDGPQIYSAALQLFDRAWDGRPVRLIGVGVGSLSSGLRQMGLWEQPDERRERLDAALEELRARFGAGVVRRASQLSDEENSEK